MQYFSADIGTRKALADIGIAAFLKMLFVDNFVHGDLHPGNIHVRIDDGKKLCVLFEIYVSVNYRFRQAGADLS